MRKAKKVEGRSCPKCKSEGNQVNHGYNRSGTQRCKCNHCGTFYTLNPKIRAYSEEVRISAIKTYYSGVSGRGVGRLLGMSKANVYNWIKKTGQAVDKWADRARHFWVGRIVLVCRAQIKRKNPRKYLYLYDDKPRTAPDCWLFCRHG